jgi:hypothetical protein
LRLEPDLLLRLDEALAPFEERLPELEERLFALVERLFALVERLLPLVERPFDELLLRLEADRLRAPDDGAFDLLDEDFLDPPPEDDERFGFERLTFPSSIVPRQDPLSSSSISM